MDLVHRINSVVCFFLGTALNSLVLYLVRKRTSEELRPYSCVLAQTAVVDLASLAVNLLFQPVYLTLGADSITGGLGLAVIDPAIGGMIIRWWNFGWYLLYLFINSPQSTALQCHSIIDTGCCAGRVRKC